MSNFNSFQYQKRGQAATPASSFARPVRSFAPLPSPSQTTHHDGEASLDHAARFGHSFARISLLPPERKNETALPDPLKAGIESLSGLSMDDVKVHYNSSKPAQVQALAYTKGTDIYVGPGQEKHLAHEAWHVVQQAQGRVQPTGQLKGMAVNDDIGLEQEASEMGDKADSGATKDTIILHPQEENQAPTSLEVDTTKKGGGNRRTFQKKNGIVTQMLKMIEADEAAKKKWGKIIFSKRVEDATATTGAHNYALDVNVEGRIQRSTTSAHAEISLLAMSLAQPKQGVVLISEYKPCPSCQKLIAVIEGAREIEVTVPYFLGYENKGDGDKDATREFYKKLGFLEGGGKYNYYVVDQ